MENPIAQMNIAGDRLLDFIRLERVPNEPSIATEVLNLAKDLMDVALDYFSQGRYELHSVHVKDASGRTFYPDLAIHLLTDPSIKHLVTCKFCHLSFLTKEVLNAHVISNHKEVHLLLQSSLSVARQSKSNNAKRICSNNKTVGKKRQCDYRDEGEESLDHNMVDSTSINTKPMATHIVNEQKQSTSEAFIPVTWMGSNVRFPVLPLLANPGGLPPNETTFAKILQNNGYRTALIGKWHQGLSCEKLGDHCHHPNNHGFDYFFGLPLTNYKNLGNDSNVIFDVRPEVSRRIGFTAFVLFSSIFIGRRYFGNGVAILMAILFVLFVSLSGGIFYTTHIWNSVLMRNEDIVEQPVNLNDRMAERLANEGIRFLSKQSADRPFLLMMSWLQAHSALHASQRFRGHSAHGAYGDEIEEIDWSVGQVLKALEYFNYLDNSIIYFTSDNGGHLEEHHGFYHYRTGGYNGIFRGGKGQGGQDGGIRMPSAIMWPGKIPSGKEVTIPTSQMDLFPTILAAAGLSLPNDRIYDGTNILRWLTEENVTDVPHKFLFHNCGTWLHAIRYTPDDGSDVFKIYYYWPMWQDNVDACADFMCTCAQHHLKLDVPKITNIARDPREIKPLDQREELYREILKVANKAKKNYEQSLIEVKNQISGSPGIHLKLLTCCSWGTMCQCNRDDENALKYTLPWK